MTREFLTLSNLLSISRILLTIPFALVMFSDIPSRTAWGVGLLAVAALTDRLDGYFARARKEETEWGRILDPLADKVGVAIVGLVLLVLGLVPAWFLLALVIRDLLILAGGVYLKARTGIVHPSIPAGKWTVGIVALALAGALVEAPAAVQYPLLAASTIMLLVSFIMYVRRFADAIALIARGTHGDS